MAPLSIGVVNLQLIMVVCMFSAQELVAANWCVSRSDASDDALQIALDYACGAGADCAPIQQSGLCFLPNTLQAHASYAFNSYFQRRGMAPGSCSFAGTSTIAKTDPSYGSCVYPSSARTAGGTISEGGSPGGTTTPTTIPITTAAPPPPGISMPLYSSPGVSTPRAGPQVPNAQDSIALSKFSVVKTLSSLLLFFAFLNVFQPI